MPFASGRPIFRAYVRGERGDMPFDGFYSPSVRVQCEEGVTCLEIKKGEGGRNPKSVGISKNCAI